MQVMKICREILCELNAHYFKVTLYFVENSTALLSVLEVLQSDLQSAIIIFYLKYYDLTNSFSTLKRYILFQNFVWYNQM